MKKNFIFVGMLLASLFFGTSVVLAKENGVGECDAVYFEQILKQARGITASAAFLQELKPEMDDSKNVAEELVKGSVEELADLVQNHEQILAEGKKEYDEATSRYFGGETVSLKND